MKTLLLSLVAASGLLVAGCCGSSSCAKSCDKACCGSASCPKEGCKAKCDKADAKTAGTACAAPAAK